MPPRPAVYGLPPELLEELNTRLVANRFSGYTELSEWLKSEGYEIGRSAVHNHGRKLEAEFEQAMADSRRMNELAKALVRADPDEQNALLEANERIAHESLMRLLLELRRVEDDPGMLAKNLPKITRAIADLGRTTIGRSKWQAEREAEVVRKTRQQDAEKLQELAATGALGLDRDTVRQTIRELYGVAV